MTTTAKLPLSFFTPEADIVAQALLGQHLIIRQKGRLQRSRIVETEAYLGTQDLACHAAKGRTQRTEVMFGPAGIVYVYLIYGMYHMLNIVVSQEHDPQAVLIRAVEPLEHIQGSTNGPGRLCKTLGITRRHNGLSLQGEEIWLEPGVQPKTITTSMRIGVDYAGEWAKKPLRFYDADSNFVSKR